MNPHQKRFYSYLPDINKILIVILTLTVITLGAIWGLTKKASITLENTQIPHASVEEKKQDAERNHVTPRTSQQMMQSVFRPLELSSPETQKVLDILETPEYQSFIETDPEGILQYIDFFSEHGLNINRQDVLAHYELEFLRRFPDSTPQALLFRMRDSLSQLFSKYDILPGTQAGLNGFTSALEEFVSSEENTIWINLFFEGNFDTFSEWVLNVLENPNHITEDFNIVEPENQRMNPLENASPPQIEISELPQLDDSQPSVRDVLLDPKPEISTESHVGNSEKGVSISVSRNGMLDFRQDKDFEEDLKDQFSQERINHAMQTIGIHGPKEGITKIRGFDPELANRLKSILSQEPKDPQ